MNLRILRIYGSSIEKKDYPAPNNKYRKPNTTCPDWAKPYALHHLIRQKSTYTELMELEEEIGDMKQNKKKPNGKKCNEHSRVLSDSMTKFLEEEKFDIVFCTCNEAAGKRVKTCLSPRQCIIDECGMAYEPETIVPLSLCEHAVLIGDHKQLQPVIDYQPAKAHGLTTSLFERYATHYKDRILYTLKTQYRMVTISLTHNIISLHCSLTYSIGLFVNFHLKSSTMINLRQTQVW